MKTSSLAHGFSIITGTIGFLAIIGAWLAGESGKFLGFSQPHLYSDAMALLIASVASGVCTLVYLKQGK